MNYRELIIKNHQIMSFNKTFAYLNPGKDIFWPGCAMLSFGSALNTAAYGLLKKSLPNLSVCTFCCGNPSIHIYEGKDFSKRVKFIEESLKDRGVENIYTLCPNCYVTLSENTGFNVKSAWSIIDESLPRDKHDILKGRSFLIHDPCPIVKDISGSEHVRNILKNLGAEIIEFKNNKEKTACCGKKNMIMALNPEKGNKIFKSRSAQIAEEEIVTYCASCVDTFRDNNFSAHHILELIFQIEGKSSWINRYDAVKNFKRGCGNA